MTAISITTHPDYAHAIEPLQTVRDCVEGSPTIKRKSTVYLKPPSMVNPDSPEQIVRYQKYLEGAEFDNFADLTRRGWLGKCRPAQTTVELPDVVSYLEQNADGDGTSLRSSISNAVSEVFQTKFTVLVAEYQGLSGVDTKSLSIADARALSPRATIKLYTRESLVNWAFRRVDGVMQLAYMALREESTTFNPESMTHDLETEVYLILALDENGNYYQQKRVDGILSERDYVNVGGRPLKWLPVEILVDDEKPIGALPKAPGMLYPICEKSLAMYRNSAEWAESRRTLVATLMTMGWKQGDVEIFKEVNGGRTQIQLGGLAANNLPEGVTYDILNSSQSMDAFTDYEDRALDRLQQLGGAVKTKTDSQRTATEAELDAAELNASLETIATNTENAYRRLVAYCSMFEGAVQPDAVEDYLEQVVITLPRDFSTPKLTVEEVRVMLDMLDRGVMTRMQFVEAMTAGGWSEKDADQIMAELDEEAPSISSLAAGMVQQSAAPMQDGEAT